ncbi:MAG: glycosyltransferase family A protein [Verrucomicrobiales bacterium]
MDDPLISVVVPIHRSGAFLEEAIRSVIEQALPPQFQLELIAVLDGPDEEAMALLQKLHPSAVILTHPENRGPSAARNTGIRKAKGRYITFIDADDVWAPNRILRDIEVLEAAENTPMPDAVMSLHQIIRQNEEGQWIHSQLDWIFLMGVGMYRREVFDRVGLFDETLYYGEDSDWFLRLWEKKIRFRLRWEVSLLYRVHEGGMTWNKTIGEKGHLQAIKRVKVAPVSFVTSFEYTGILWAAVFGFVFFADVPVWTTWAGAAIVIAAGLYMLHRDSRSQGLP